VPGARVAVRGAGTGAGCRGDAHGSGSARRRRPRPHEQPSPTTAQDALRSSCRGGRAWPSAGPGRRRRAPRARRPFLHLAERAEHMGRPAARSRASRRRIDPSVSSPARRLRSTISIAREPHRGDRPDRRADHEGQPPAGAAALHVGQEVVGRRGEAEDGRSARNATTRRTGLEGHGHAGPGRAKRPDPEEHVGGAWVEERVDEQDRRDDRDRGEENRRRSATRPRSARPRRSQRGR